MASCPHTHWHTLIKWCPSCEPCSHSAGTVVQWDDALGVQQWACYPKVSFFQSQTGWEKLCGEIEWERLSAPLTSPVEVPLSKLPHSTCLRGGIVKWPTVVEGSCTEHQQCHDLLQCECEGGHSCKRGWELGQNSLNKVFFFKVNEMRNSEWKCFSLGVTKCERSSNCFEENARFKDNRLHQRCLPAKQKGKVNERERGMEEPKCRGQKRCST